MSNPGGHIDHTQLPQIGISEILGLIELLHSKGGREDIYKLAAELQMEFGETLAVIRAAETLGLVNTPGGDVVVEPVGQKLVSSRINQRKSIIRKQLQNLPLFKTIHDFLKERENHQASREEVMEKLAELLPNEDAEQGFKNLVSWGRYAEIFSYSDDSHELSLDSGGDSGKEVVT